MDLAGVDLLRLADSSCRVKGVEYRVWGVGGRIKNMAGRSVYYLYHISATYTPKFIGLYLAGVDLLRLADEVVVVAHADVHNATRPEEQVEVLARREKLRVGVEVGKRRPLRTVQSVSLSHFGIGV